MSDKQRVLDLLIERGPEGVTSHELRISGTTGNPSERCRELIADGHRIEAEQTHRVDPHGKKRPMTVYRLLAGAGGRTREEARTTAPSRRSAAASSGQPETGGVRSPQGEMSAGAAAPVDPPRLFEIPAPSRYEDAA